MEYLDPLPEEEQEELFQLYKKSKDPSIKDKLILHNLKLVSWTVLRYYRSNKLEYDDYFQTGTIGLIKSIETYDPEKGSFATHSIYAIRGAITRELENTGRTIRIASHMIQKRNKLLRIKEELFTFLEREPTTRELSYKSELSLEEINEILTLIDDPTSLNIYVGGEEDLTLEDSIKDVGLTPDEIVENKIFIEQFKKEAKEILTDLQYNLIIDSFGFNGEVMTYKDLAIRHKCKNAGHATRERQIALRTLRQSQFFQEMKEEVEERTSYVKGIDYSQPKVSGGYPSSQVEKLVIHRESMRKEILARFKKESKIKNLSV